MSYDSPAILKEFSQRMHIEYPLLSDSHSAIIKQFGILNDTVAKNDPVYGIPYPGIYVLDAKGIITAKFFEDDYSQRDTAGMILLKQFGIAPEKKQAVISAKHIALTAAATDPSPHMGQRVSIVLDGELPHNVHVYAPGVKGYIAIDWKLPETPAFKVGAVTYPPSTLMRLEAINETVPVYAGHFRLIRDITLSGDKQIEPLLDKRGDLVLSGTFRYQACDEEKCFIPESIPISLSLHFQPVDRTRVPEKLRARPGV